MKRDEIKDLIGKDYDIPADEVEEDLFDQYVLKNKIEVEEGEVKVEKKSEEQSKVIAEDEFDVLGILSNQQDERHPLTKRIVDALTKLDPVGNEQHPLHKPMADTRRRYDEMNEKFKEHEAVMKERDALRQSIKDLELSNASAKSGFKEVKEDGRVIYVDADNDPRQRKYGGMTWNEAVEDEKVPEFNQALYDYNARIGEHIQNVSQFKSQSEKRQKEEDEGSRAFMEERKAFIESVGKKHGIDEAGAQKLEETFGSPKHAEAFAISLLRGETGSVNAIIDFLHEAKQHGGIVKYIEIARGQAAVTDLNKAQKSGGEPITNQAGGKFTPKGKITLDDISVEELQNMDPDSPEFAEVHRQYEQAVKDGRIKLQRQ